MNSHLIDRLQKLGHGMPRTRREFLSMGTKSISAFAVAPGLMGLWNEAAAAVDPRKSPKSMPFMVFDMAGGSGLPGNFMVGGKRGQDDELPSYSVLGWNPKRDKIDRRFGAPMADREVSKILEGILNYLSPEAASKLRIATICHQSQDDSGSNTTSALVEVSRFGFSAKALSRGIGTGDSNAGGNTQSPTSDPLHKPLRVQSLADLQNAVGFGALGGKFNKLELRQFLRGAPSIASHQLKNRNLECKNSAELQALTSQALKKLQRLIDKPINFNALDNSLITGIFDQNSPPQSPEAINIPYNVIAGNTGPGCITIGSCDYHDGTSETGDERDQTAGAWIGISVEIAHRFKKPFMFQLLTDGGVYADKGTRKWRGDAGDKSMTVVGFYHPDAAPKLRRTQLGHYTVGQGADRSEPFGSNTSIVAGIVAANYLHALGRTTEIEKLIPRDMIPTEKLDDYLLFS